ncbi:MAG: hypothetical protein HYV90_05730 [Candidatus Woesebacteria bacterium]|nr:MAG: hypothetical protein HYV90_05730 [Candidatus Woesebacteria bacterium]
MDNLTRRNIRYICFRLQTEAEGGSKAEAEETGIMSYVDQIKELMESQSEFEGWKKFAKTWDVGEEDPLKAVNRLSSIQNDWNKVLKKEAKELSVNQPKKIVQRGPGGRFVSKKTKTENPVLPPPETEESPTPKKSIWDVLK